jgi:Cu+-exporting ATPase
MLLPGESNVITKNDTLCSDRCGQKQAVLQIRGMMCMSCVSRVKAAVRGLNGVSAAAVSLSEGKAIVTYDPSNISIGDLAAAVEAAGYKVA